MSYVEREAAFNAILKLIPKVDDDGYCWVIRGDAAMAIDSIPAADVVERASGIIGVIPTADVRPVVTCGECKHWFENGTDYCSCDRDALLRERDFFCAAGEKREES